MFNENGVFFKCIREFIEGKTTIQDIEEFERTYNIKLSNDYIEFLVKNNGIISSCGLKINNFYYSLYNTYLEKIDNSDFEVFENLPEIIKTIHEYLSDEEVFNKIDIIKNKKILPIAGNMSASSDLGIGYGEDNFGKIYTWRLDWDYEIFFVCNSFKEFIEGYYLIETDEDGEPIGTEKIFMIE